MLARDKLHFLLRKVWLAMLPEGLLLLPVTTGRKRVSFFDYPLVLIPWLGLCLFRIAMFRVPPSGSSEESSCSSPLNTTFSLLPEIGVGGISASLVCASSSSVPCNVLKSL